MTYCRLFLKRITNLPLDRILIDNNLLNVTIYAQILLNILRFCNECQIMAEYEIWVHYNTL